MGVQVITTEAGEELVVLPRRDYDRLLAQLGDEDAEDRMTSRIAADMVGRIEQGAEVIMPAALVDRLIAGDSPLRAVRLLTDQTIPSLAAAARLPEPDVEAFDRGTRQPTATERGMIAQALAVDPRWLDGLDD